MQDGGIERAVVFPGQGTVGEGITGAARDAALDYIGDEAVPYQLSVFAGSVDLLYRLRGVGIEPDLVAGHSLGEYAAAHAAGSVGLADGVRLVAERDRLMSEAARQNPGGMVALIGADPDDVAGAAEETGGIVVAANFNTPRQTVVSGQVDALEEVAERVRGRKVRLDVSGAFHSPLMAEAAREMAELLGEVDLEEPEIPMIGATDGALLTTAEKVREALRNQMLSPVRWVAVVERLLDLGVREIFEAGEDGTLTRMLRDFERKDVDGRTVREVFS
ncbi:MAG: ACP S-malonyltransferase [Actinomycetota bacterium]|nr:ACP S-malonyltransferase [Actinomycetota bacterium]HYZ05990.1 ACP S-malonyltransferase [Rubrobacter sp.]